MENACNIFIRLPVVFDRRVFDFGGFVALDLVGINHILESSHLHKLDISFLPLRIFITLLEVTHK